MLHPNVDGYIDTLVHPPEPADRIPLNVNVANRSIIAASPARRSAAAASPAYGTFAGSPLTQYRASGRKQLCSSGHWRWLR